MGSSSKRPPTSSLARPQGQATLTLAFGSIAIALTSDDPATAEWLAQFLEPWFTPTLQTAEWRVRLSSSKDAYAALRDRRPRGALVRPCFARDRQTLCLPAWTADGRVVVADSERSCF